MAATAQTRNWDIAWTTSNDVHRKRITDNINNQNTTLEVLRRKDRVEVDSGGRIIREDLYYGNGTMTWMSGRQVVPTDEPDGVTAAFFETRYAVVPLVISFTEEQESQSSDAAMRLLATKTIQARNTLQNGINAAIWSAASGKSMLGFQDILKTDPTTGTLGGINQANETWWRNITETTGGNFNAASAPSYIGLLRMSTAYNSASDGNDEITDIFMGLTFYGELQEILEGTGYARLTLGDGSAKVDAGKPGFRSATIHKDRDVPSGAVYGINNRYFKLKIQRGANFAKTQFVDGHAGGQLARVSFMVAGLQLVTNNPRRGFSATGLT